VPIREVEAGDTVFAFDEDKNVLIPAPVKGKAYKGERPVFEMKVATRFIRATENHPFLALTYECEPGKQRGRYKREWKYLRDLKVGDLVAVSKQVPEFGQSSRLNQPQIKTVVTGRNQFGVEYDLDINNRYNEIELPELSTTDLMWWFGLYIGDGFIHHTKGTDKARVEIAIPKKDAQLRDELSRITEDLFGIAAKSTDDWRVSVNSTILARYIEANGFDGKAKTKRVPHWVFELPEVQRLAFLGGYIDADGYVRDSSRNHDISLTSVNRELLQDVRALALSCGISTSEIHRFSSTHGDAYRMQFSGNFDKIGCRSEQRNSRMGLRKYFHAFTSAHGTTFKNHTNEHIGFAKIERIAPAGIAPVYDIEVDGPHNFVAEGLIVHNSEVIYHNLAKDLEEKGVIFKDTDSALREHPELFREYFGTIIPYTDNKFAALNSAVWSGGSFIYVPKGVKIDMPLQAYFRINAKNVGQFERTLIIVDEGAQVHYVEGCFLAGARVRVRGGEKPIEQIQVGDEVLTHKGRYRRVYNTMRRSYSGMIYNIKYFGDSRQMLRVTEEHPLLVVKREQLHNRNKQFNTEWAVASQVKPGDYLAIPIPKTELQSYAAQKVVTIPFGYGRHEVQERNVTLKLEPDFFRLLGYYHAEGHVDNEHYLTFTFNANESTYLDDTKELVARYFGKAPNANKARQNGQTLVLSSTETARTFAREFGSSIRDKRVPDYVLNAPLTQLKEWVRGMWCGDGSYDERKNMFRFNTVSTELAYAFRDALLRLGIAASVNYQLRDEPRQPMFAVIISSPHNQKFGEIVDRVASNGNMSGSPFHMDGNFMYVPIRSVEIEEMDTLVYNFSVEEDESYVGEGVVSHNCTAPVYSSDSLHSAVVEIIVKKGGRCRYTTIQNWSTNVYNLVTKRAAAYQDATMEWVDGNLGSKLTMKYPAVYLMEPGAHGEILSIAFAGKGQHQDAGGKVVHAAPNTTSKIVSKSISKDGGRTSYRGLLKVYKDAVNAKSNVVCDALLLDEASRSDTYPYIEVDNEQVNIGHEASVSKIGEEQLFYAMSRGVSEEDASTMVVSGFIEPLVKELPMEYAMEMNRLIALQMEGTVG
jgi:Fe-S cluster assembly protein SufB